MTARWTRRPKDKQHPAAWPERTMTVTFRVNCRRPAAVGAHVNDCLSHAETPTHRTRHASIRGPLRSELCARDAVPRTRDRADAARRVVRQGVDCPER